MHVNFLTSNLIHYPFLYTFYTKIWKFIHDFDFPHIDGGICGEMWPNVQMNEVFHHRAAVSVPCHQEELWMGLCGFEVKMRLTISLSCLNWPQLFANMHSIHWCCCCLLETGTPLWENMNEELYFFGVRRHLRYWPIYGQVQVSWVLLFYELPRWFASYPYSS